MIIDFTPEEIKVIQSGLIRQYLACKDDADHMEQRAAIESAEDKIAAAQKAEAGRAPEDEGKQEQTKELQIDNFW